MWQANMGDMNLEPIMDLLSVMMHLRQGKKVSILPSGDMNPGPVPSRRRLLEDSLFCAVGAVCPSCDESRLRT
jgi:hypothetical protein